MKLHFHVVDTIFVGPFQNWCYPQKNYLKKGVLKKQSIRTSVTSTHKLIIFHDLFK